MGTSSWLASDRVDTSPPEDHSPLPRAVTTKRLEPTYAVTSHRLTKTATHLHICHVAKKLRASRQMPARQRAIANGGNAGRPLLPCQTVTTELAIEIDRLTCAYGEVPVLEDVTLAIRQGAFVGIVGPSGAGKTTLLRALLGAVQPSEGAIRVFGREVTPGQVPRVGYVPQLETVDWNFPVTVSEVVAMGLAVEGRMFSLPWLSRAHKRRVQGLLERLGIGDLAGRHIRDLSGGQQQRVFLARALVREPRLLLLDEPTTGVDIKTRHDVLHLLAELNHEGVTVVLTTHDLNSVAAHLPQVVCLNRRVVAYGTAASVFTSAVLEATYGAEMIVVHQGELTLIADKLGVFRDITDQHSHPEGADHKHPEVMGTR
jgi:zinc/manganese transport system ATP-binding protein